MALVNYENKQLKGTVNSLRDELEKTQIGQEEEIQKAVARSNDEKTQLKDTVKRVFDAGAVEMHMRPACPPLVFGCKFLNFSRSRSVMDLAGRRAVEELEGTSDNVPDAYFDPDSEEYANMVEIIRKRLGLTSLRYQRLDDLIEAIGLPKDNLCTYCWDAKG